MPSPDLNTARSKQSTRTFKRVVHPFPYTGTTLNFINLAQREWSDNWATPTDTEKDMSVGTPTQLLLEVRVHCLQLQLTLGDRLRLVLLNGAPSTEETIVALRLSSTSQRRD